MNSDKLDALNAHIAEMEGLRLSQPQRLAEARERADDERIKSLMAEPWADFIRVLPSVDIGSMLSMPTIEAKEVFGTRLAFDLLAHCGDEEKVAQILRDYFKMTTGSPGHMFLICAAALDTIANHVMPALLSSLEHQASDYDTRVRMADGAREAWTVRVADLGEFAEGKEVPSDRDQT